ncbi:EspA/EspE family type VII secretion system effector [Mycobacterium marinum]|uniref:EspA/EspE family type VII secretion system effector n=1 Tax=Mycobacterium marinum TaxID=1781 RepID=UPI0023585E3E|nr:EspA/EspE family type VII secretion system effector [Mycobacterium marinum]MDC9002832.1 EspA/EspE family type VII secretion system effector [Mycobacterium marinum]
MREWLGAKSPERGDRLESSASMFDDVDVRVAGLVADGDWRGAAAQAYGARAAAQSQYAALMADLDRLTAELVSSQADAVEQARKDLLRQIIITGVFLLFAISLESGGCDEISMWVGVAIWIFNALTVPSILIKLAITTSRNANEVQAAAQRVTDLLAASTAGSQAALGRPVLASPGAGVAPAAGVSQFAVVDHTAPSPLTVELGSALAELPGAPQFHLATEAGAGLADFGAPGLPIPPLTGMPPLPDPAHLPTLPDLPDVSAVLAALPTIAPLSTTLGQLGGLAGPTNAPRARHPTPDHDSPDTAGAAATTTNHRAPIDTQTRPATGATHSPLPHSS